MYRSHNQLVDFLTHVAELLGNSLRDPDLASTDLRQLKLYEALLFDTEIGYTNRAPPIDSSATYFSG